MKKGKGFLENLIKAFVVITLLILIGLNAYETWALRQDISSLNANLIIAGTQSAKPEEVTGKALDSIEDTTLSESEIVQSMEDHENEEVSTDDLKSSSVDSSSVTASSDIRRVYLTFDDGPSSNTDEILDILDSYGVKATFFVVGNEDYTDEYRRIVEEGHTLAMHSYSHKYSEIYSSVEAYEADLERLHSFLYEVTGEDCQIVRFPGGSSNKISNVDMSVFIDYLDSKGMPYFDWNVSSGDAASGYVSAEQIANNVLRNIDKYDEAVVLMHDASSKDTTVEALPLIIESILESEDTVLLPLSVDTKPVQHISK